MAKADKASLIQLINQFLCKFWLHIALATPKPKIYKELDTTKSLYRDNFKNRNYPPNWIFYYISSKEK